MIQAGAIVGFGCNVRANLWPDVVIVFFGFVRWTVIIVAGILVDEYA
jgi:hypothetical protein